MSCAKSREAVYAAGSVRADGEGIDICLYNKPTVNTGRMSESFSIRLFAAMVATDMNLTNWPVLKAQWSPAFSSSFLLGAGGLVVAFGTRVNQYILTV